MIQFAITNKQKGFSLLEIMAVVIIMAILGTVAAVGVVGQIEKSRLRTTKTQISVLESAISLFEMECGFTPTTLDDLIQAPTSRKCKGYPKAGYLKKKAVPQDAWNNDFSYDPSGSKSGMSYDIWSNGKDGDEGTGDDVTSWDAESGEDEDLDEDI